MNNALVGLNFNAPTDIGRQWMQALLAGREFGQQVATKNAVNALATDPTNPALAYEVMRHQPALGMKLREFQMEEAERDREAQFRAALGRYTSDRGALGGGTNALGTSLPTETPMGLPGPRSMTPAQVGPAQHGGLDLSFLGDPADDDDAAFLDMLRIDPVQAMKVRSTMRDDFVEQIEADRKVLDWAVSHFGGVTDEASYQAARQELQSRLGPRSGGLMNSLPERYPGPEALGQLRLKALDTKDQIAHFQSQANIDADNLRADRNTDSLIADRSARTSIMRENTRSDNARADRNTDSLVATRRAGAKRRGRREALPVVDTPEQAMKLPPGTRFKVRSSGEVLTVPND